MQISKHKVVTIDYQLTDDAGNVIDESSDGEFAYLHGERNIIPGLENALASRKVGDQFSVRIEPSEGYGERNDSLVQVVELSAFPSREDVEVGRQFHAQSDEGHPIVVTITDIEGDDVTIDANHPLAGITLNFAVTIREIRDASEEEKEHGHVHGPEGHHH